MNLINAPMSHPAFAEARWHDAAWQHRTVMSLFGDLGGSPQARANGNVLFRVEPDTAAHDTTPGRILIQSTAPPEADGLAVRDLTPLFATYQPGAPVRLTLRANTVRTINRTTGGVTRTHRARIPDADLDGWFKDRIGHAVDLAYPPAVIDGTLRRGKAQLITTTFLAEATVTDPDALIALVREGIGRAKAYGCGMLTALPAR